MAGDYHACAHPECRRAARDAGSRGLFARIAIEGPGITIDERANAAFYGSSSITAEQIFASGGNAAPPVANDFVQLLTAQTQRLPKQPAMASDATAPADTAAEPKPKVRTFGIGAPDEEQLEDPEFAREEF